ncbi:protein suppressor of hairy wing isoform X2 [Condylostylus longicornis]|uniref:protein suppressor of hairy wing isoform X2 n=1 Tax=Condylostylus longicornis TaxID=2530218 RepID=UPI00244DAC70|nr:protein suppressor of hairy wing isoform X2 [Condylostylus longicornis]
MDMSPEVVFNILKKHLTFCSESIRQMWENLKEIEEESAKMQFDNLCYCCGDSFETCHSGHIRCPECPKSFRNAKSYERHVFLIHSNSDKHPCGTCNAKCPSEKILKLHEEHHKNRGKPFACKKCGNEFTRLYHLKRHIKYSGCDTKTAEEFVCNVCSKVFHRVDNLRNHLRAHLGEEKNNRDYPCPYCEKSFCGTSTLNIHIRTHTGERPFACDLCEKFFPSNAALRKHRRYHTGEKPYQCALCERAFAAKEVLNRHMKTHTGEKPHSCEICKKSFIQATQLRNHMKNHDTSKSKGFECALCNQSFNRKSKLSKHLINEHSLAAQQFNCTICTYSFKSKAGLRTHFTRCHKEEQFSCSKCKETFDDEKVFNFHKLTHSDNEDDGSEEELIPVIDMNQCNICFESFPTQTGLKRHSLKKHPGPKNIKKEAASPRLLNGSTQSKKVTSPPPKRSKKEKVTKKTGEIIEEFIIEELPENHDAEMQEEETSSNLVKSNGPSIHSREQNTMQVMHSSPAKSETTVSNNDRSPTKYEEEESINLEEVDEILLEIDKDSFLLKLTEPKLSEADEKFKDNITKLLNFLVDEKTLSKFGWPEAPVEIVLQKVILNCGHKINVIDNSIDYITRMREYVKIFFNVVVESDTIKDLLNNLTIDEVIDHFVSKAEDI